MKTALCLFTEGTDIVCLFKKTLRAQIVTFCLFFGRTDGNFDAEYNLFSVCLLLLCLHVLPDSAAVI